jgi:hypothetical protein
MHQVRQNALLLFQPLPCVHNPAAMYFCEYLLFKDLTHEISYTCWLLVGEVACFFGDFL